MSIEFPWDWETITLKKWEDSRLWVESILSPFIQEISIWEKTITTKSLGKKVFEIQIDTALYTLSNFDSYETFYDKIAQILTQLYLEASYIWNDTTYTSYYYWEWYVYMRYGKYNLENIQKHIADGTYQVNHIELENNWKLEDTKKFFFWYFRYFILESGRNIPWIKSLEENTSGHQIFFINTKDFEHDSIDDSIWKWIDDIIQHLSLVNKALFEPLDTWETHSSILSYLLYLISLSNDVHENGIAYFEYVRRFFVKYIHSFTPEDILIIYKKIFDQGWFFLHMFSTELNIPSLLLDILLDTLLESDTTLEEGYKIVQNFLQNPLYKEVFPKICALYYWDFPVWKEVNSAWFILYYLWKNWDTDKEFTEFLIVVELLLQQDWYKILSNISGSIDIIKPELIEKWRTKTRHSEFSLEERLALLVFNPELPQIEIKKRKIEFKPKILAPSIVLNWGIKRVKVYTNENARWNIKYDIWEGAWGVREVIKLQVKNILMEDVWEATNKWQSLLFWFHTTHFPIGWKIHFPQSIEEERFSPLTQYFWFWKTPFKLLHSNTSLCLPPCSSPYQLIAIIYKLTELWILEGDELELQLSLPGRVPNELAWILWSAMIFLKNYQVSFSEASFTTSHNTETMTCMMCYDAWVLDKQWFDIIPDNCTGRTDILWLKRIEEVMNYFTVWNFITQSYFWWPQEHIWKEFIQKYMQLLKKYWIDRILTKKWVHNPDVPSEKQWWYEEHAQVVKICTDILNSDIQRVIDTWERSGLIFELRQLVEEFSSSFKLDKNSMSLLGNT